MNKSRTFGLEVGGAAAVSSFDSKATNNTGTGFLTGGGVLRLAHSAATGNATGVDASFGTAESAGNNFIRGNTTDVSGTLKNVGTQ